MTRIRASAPSAVSYLDLYELSRSARQLADLPA